MRSKMDLEVMKKLIEVYASGHREYTNRCREAKRYYENRNDILYKTVPSIENNPLRNADNRVPRNFHGLLVNQKASYLFTAPPLFDVGNQEINTQISEILGDAYAKVCKDLSVNASNCGCAWLHYWINKENKFEYGVVDSEQIIPIFTPDLNQKLYAVFRNYKSLDLETGKEQIIWEYWTDKNCYIYKSKQEGYRGLLLEPYNIYQDTQGKECNIIQHEFGEVPFIPFFNNNIKTNDLVNIKQLIDAYDKVFNGFLNDLEDIQDIIFVLTNYGGTDLENFLQDLKKYKTIELGGGTEDEKGDLRTLTINIPVEARREFLELTRKAIFEQGQGVDPDPQNYGNASGVALKFLYSLLELKAGLAETEFKIGFGTLIRAISRYLSTPCKKIIQTWTRTAVSNDAENAEICSKSVGIISNRTIIRNHPFVEDTEDEEKQLEKEREKEEEENDIYEAAFEEKEDKGGEVENEE